MIATQIEMSLLRPMVELESMLQQLQESVLSAKVLHRCKREVILKRRPRVLLNIMEILKLGSMIATQIEMSLPRPMVEQVLMQPQQVLESNVKDLLKAEEEVLLNTTEILRLGLMTAIQTEMFRLRPILVVPELGKLDKMDPSQE